MRRAAIFLALSFALLGLPACGGGDGDGGDGGGEGGGADGQAIFEAQGCGNCHTLEAAGSSGTTGPDLDESLADDDEASIRQDIVRPDAEIVEGFQEGVMPKDYGEKLSDEELNALVSFLAESK